MDEEDEGFTDWLQSVAYLATKRASTEALNNGRSIVYMEGNDIIRLYPDGTKEIIKTLENTYVKISKMPAVWKLRSM